MLRFERRKMSQLLGNKPYVRFSLSYGEKARVFVLSENKVIESFTSESWDVDLTPEVKFIVVFRQTRSQQVTHVFQVVERIGQPDIVEIARFTGKTSFRQWALENLGSVPVV